MSRREEIASDLADRFGSIRRYAGPVTASFWNAKFEWKVRDLLSALNEMERLGKIILVTDDVAVFSFPIDNNARQERISHEASHS